MRTPSDPITLHIHAQSHDGRGIATSGNKVTFVDNALTGESVEAKIRRKHRRFDEADAVSILSPSVERVTPPCIHTSLCGGCRLQHQATDAQVRFHEHSVAEQCKRLGHVTAETWVEPITGPTSGYRRKARLGVRYVRKKEKLLVGFREKHSNYLAEIQTCPVLDPRIGLKLPELSSLIHSLEAFDTLPLVEVAAGDTDIALIFRHMHPLSDNDIEKIKAFGNTQGIHIYLQPGAPSTVHKLWPEDGQNYLTYSLPHHELTLRFHPTDFTQVNAEVNRQMIDQALNWLALSPNDRVLDLFCGLGNFSLPMAKYAASVTGVEGCREMTARATDNAQLNGVHNTAFITADLARPDPHAPWLNTPWDCIVLDPPRTGAAEIITHIAKLNAHRILYISCNPATLARDAGILVNEHGYRMTRAGIMDMFPHTGHVESMALFEAPTKEPRKR